MDSKKQVSSVETYTGSNTMLDKSGWSEKMKALDGDNSIS